MHFFKAFLLPALATSVLASPVVERAANSSTQLINQISGALTKDIQTLNSTLNRFRPDSTIDAFNALIIQGQTQQISKDLVKATQIANQSAPFTLDDSARVATAVLNLQPSIQSLLNNIVMHKHSFETVFFFLDLSKTVKQSLVTQKQQSNAFGQAVGAKLQGIFGFFAPAVNQQIQDYFTTAIAAYQNCGAKTVCLPPLPQS